MLLYLGEINKLKKIKLLLIIFLLFGFLMFNSMALATVTQSGADPGEGSTNVHVTDDFTVLLNATNGTMDYNMSLYHGATLIQSTTATAQSNGTKTFTLDTMNGTTLYQIRVNVNDSDGYTNNTYNFTTGILPLTLDTDTFGTAEILMLGIIIIVISLGFLYYIVTDIQKKGKIDVKDIVNKLTLVIFFVVMISILAYMI
jgi:hypothetical protein